ncbi:MAG: glycosyltransferase family 1 protein [Nitrospiraceae bacterium]|nr:glycosyltransferase family 1 protein [Nitrospiraceae bacterium]
MKVLYLTDAGQDYLADQIYDGLCAVIGREGVIDFPRKPIYHSEPPEGTLSSRPCELALDEQASFIREGAIDLVIVSSPRQGAVKACRDLAGCVALPPVVLLDGEDDRRIRQDLARVIHAGLYFKRELPLSSVSTGHEQRRAQAGEGLAPLEGRVQPLPFSVTSAELEPLPDLARDVDVSFVGRASHRKRVRAVRLLREARDIRFEGGIYAESTDRASKLTDSWFGMMAAKLRGDPPGQGSITKFGREGYRALLARSKTALSVRGGGFDTLRYWEIAASKIPLISEVPDILIPHNLEHGVHAIFCRPDLGDLVEWVRRLRDDEGERNRLAHAAYHHVLAHHTSARRATYMLDLCRKML